MKRRNGCFFDEEVLKLDRWSDDLKQGLKREIKAIDKQVREARRVSVLAGSLHDKLESTRNRMWRELFDAQDAIDAQRDDLIVRIGKQLAQRFALEPVFTFRWRQE